MKKLDKKFTTYTTYSNGEHEIKTFCSEKTMSKYANRQFAKDEGVTVEVYHFGSLKLYCTYHA